MATAVATSHSTVRNATPSATHQHKAPSGSLNPSPEFTLRHGSVTAKPSTVTITSSSSSSSSSSSANSTSSSASSSCSSNEAINRAILIEKPTLMKTFNATTHTEVAQNRTNESKPLDMLAPLSTSSASDSSSQDQPLPHSAAPPKSRTHILRTLFFSLPNTAEASTAPTEATVECGHATGSRTKTVSAPLSSPLSPSSSSSVSSQSSASSTTPTAGPTADKAS